MSGGEGFVLGAILGVLFAMLPSIVMFWGHYRSDSDPATYRRDEFLQQFPEYAWKCRILRFTPLLMVAGPALTAVLVPDIFNSGWNSLTSFAVPFSFAFSLGGIIALTDSLFGVSFGLYVGRGRLRYVGLGKTYRNLAIVQLTSFVTLMLGINILMFTDR